MTEHGYYMVHLRESLALRCIAITFVLSASMISVPQADLSTILTKSEAQKILPLNPIPTASPGHITKSTPEFAELTVTVLDKADLNENLQIYTVLDNCSQGYSRKLTSCLIYSQTTSSCL
jgi:hypothetical protein